MAACFAFAGFVLDTAERRLVAGDQTVDLNARYFDALALLVGSQGQLVHKDRFMAEVWRGIPVTDEALTQCIRTLRRQLGDDASQPRFIQTVPKHGYRFIAPVRELDGGDAVTSADRQDRWPGFVRTGVAGTAGGTIAGVVGGLVFGFAAASQAHGVGGLSVLLVLLCATAFIAAIGAAGISFAIAAARLVRSNTGQWTIAGGAGGGLFVGALGKLLGVDALTLLVGRAPVDITGSMEGLLLGAGIGAALAVAPAFRSLRLRTAMASALGAAAGVISALLGGRLMLGSVESLARAYPGSRLQLDQVSGLVGERALGWIGRVGATAIEGALFSACIVAAILLADRYRRRGSG